MKRIWFGALVGAFIGFSIGAIGTLAYVLTGGLEVAPKGWGALAAAVTLVAVVISAVVGAVIAEDGL